jgi:hypothetical protein
MPLGNEERKEENGVISFGAKRPSSSSGCSSSDDSSSSEEEPVGRSQGMPAKGQPIISITPSSNELPPATPEFIHKEVQKPEFSNQFDEKPSEIAERIKKEEEERNVQQMEIERPIEPEEKP